MQVVCSVCGSRVSSKASHPEQVQHDIAILVNSVVQCGGRIECWHDDDAGHFELIRDGVVRILGHHRAGPITAYVKEESGATSHKDLTLVPVDRSGYPRTASLYYQGKVADSRWESFRYFLMDYQVTVLQRWERRNWIRWSGDAAGQSQTVLDLLTNLTQQDRIQFYLSSDGQNETVLQMVANQLPFGYGLESTPRRTYSKVLARRNPFTNTELIGTWRDDSPFVLSVRTPQEYRIRALRAVQMPREEVVALTVALHDLREGTRVRYALVDPKRKTIRNEAGPFSLINPGYVFESLLAEPSAESENAAYARWAALFRCSPREGVTTYPHRPWYKFSVTYRRVADNRDRSNLVDADIENLALFDRGTVFPVHDLDSLFSKLA